MKNQLLKITLLACVGFLSFSCSDVNDTVEIISVDIENFIQKESELFGLIERVAETEDEITCIKFLYSFTMLEFIFEDYITCILKIEDLEELGTNDTIAFYETENDAFFIIPITIRATIC